MSDLKISWKIGVGFLIVILVISLFVVYTIKTLNTSKTLYGEITEAFMVKELQFNINNSRGLINDWVYNPNENKQEELTEIVNSGYPDLKEKINSTLFQSKVIRQELQPIIDEFDKVIESEKLVMDKLKTVDDYMENMGEVEFIIQDSVFAKIDQIMVSLDAFIEKKQIEDKLLKNDMINSFDHLKILLFSIIILVTLIGILSSYYIGKIITVPIVKLKNLLTVLSGGELPEAAIKITKDEVGQITGAVNEVINGLKKTSEFATAIGDGNFESDFEKLSDKDVLGNALINMRENLQKVAEEDKKRNWGVAGLAKFGDILRNHDEDLSQLATNIMSNLVKYLEANQGGLFIVNDDNADEIFLELVAFYAWDRQKFLQQKIMKGEGMAGQCWQEGKSIYINDVPDSYVNISSGLGEANPRSVLIIPLKVNDQIYGVLELASFNDFDDHHKEFLEKLTENIASTLSSVRTNTKTKSLLEDTQQQAEEMRAQEEEMRQNQEELQATQEELGRQKTEMEEEMVTLKKELEEYKGKGKKSPNGQKVSK